MQIFQTRTTLSLRNSHHMRTETRTERWKMESSQATINIARVLMRTTHIQVIEVLDKAHNCRWQRTQNAQMLSHSFLALAPLGVHSIHTRTIRSSIPFESFLSLLHCFRIVARSVSNASLPVEWRISTPGPAMNWVSNSSFTRSQWLSHDIVCHFCIETRLDSTRILSVLSASLSTMAAMEFMQRTRRLRTNNEQKSKTKNEAAKCIPLHFVGARGVRGVVSSLRVIILAHYFMQIMVLVTFEICIHSTFIVPILRVARSVFSRLTVGWMVRQAHSLSFSTGRLKSVQCSSTQFKRELFCYWLWPRRHHRRERYIDKPQRYRCIWSDSITEDAIQKWANCHCRVSANTTPELRSQAVPVTKFDDEKWFSAPSSSLLSLWWWQKTLAAFASRQMKREPTYLPFSDVNYAPKIWIKQKMVCCLRPHRFCGFCDCVKHRN